MYNKIIIRYGEIGIKSKYTRRRFEHILKNNIEIALKRCNIEGNIEISHRRLILTVDSEDINNSISILKRISGIVSFSPSLECNLNMDDVKKTSMEVFTKEIMKILRDKLEQDNTITFSVKTKRVKKEFPNTSMEINKNIGGHIIKEFESIKLKDDILKNVNLKVDLKNPKIYIGIEIIDRAYIFTKIFKGVGGLPVGTQGKLLALLSDGIDSPVASYLMMKRGCNITFLHLKLTDEGLEKVKKLFSILNNYDPTSNLVIVDYKETLKKIGKTLKEIGKERYTCLICKRTMLRIAEKYAKKLGCDGIVIGDNIGQVASQTLKNMVLINEGISHLILRPLIGFDKVEIINIAKEIGTYDISISKEIECFAVPKYPITQGNIDEVKKIEEIIK